MDECNTDYGACRIIQFLTLVLDMQNRIILLSKFMWSVSCSFNMVVETQTFQHTVNV